LKHSIMKSSHSVEPTSILLDFEMVPGPSPVETAEEMDRSADPEAHKVMVGAGILGGVLGCVFCGPTMACIAGIGAAYGTTRESPAGGAARSMGYLAISCCSKATELNDNHQILAKTQATACSCWKTTKDLAEENRVAERTSSLAKQSWQGLKNMNNDYQIADRSWQGISTTLNAINDNILGTSSESGPAVPTVTASTVDAEPAGEVAHEGNASVRGEYTAVPGTDHVTK
jgi:hypothetical protein